MGLLGPLAQPGERLRDRQEAARSSRAGTTGGKQERVYHAVRTPRGEQVAQGTVIPPRQPSLFRRPPGRVDGPAGGAVHNIGESVRRPLSAGVGLLAGTLVTARDGRPGDQARSSPRLAGVEKHLHR